MQVFLISAVFFEPHLGAPKYVLFLWSAAQHEEKWE